MVNASRGGQTTMFDFLENGCIIKKGLRDPFDGKLRDAEGNKR